MSNRTIRILRAAACVPALLAAGRAAQADVVTWTGGAGNTSWQVAGNWSNSATLAATNSYSASGTTVTLARDDTTTSIAFAGGSLTLTGGSALSLFRTNGGGLITTNTLIPNLFLNGGVLSAASSNGSVTQNLYGSLSLSGSNTITYTTGNFAHTLNINSVINGSGLTIITDTSGGNAGNTKSIAFTGNASGFTGTISTVGAAAANPVLFGVNNTGGWGGGLLTVGANSKIAVSAAVNKSGSTMTFTSAASTATFSGISTIGTIGGTVANSVILNNQLTLAGNATNTLAAVVGGTAAFTKQGTGSFILTASNAFTGNVNIAGGGVGIASAYGLGTATANFTAASTTLNYTSTAAVTGVTNINLPAAVAGNFNIVKNASTFSTGTQLDLSNIVISGGSATATAFFNSNTGSDNTTTYRLGSNTFTGTINVNRGGVIVARDESFGAAGNLVYMNTNTHSTLGDIRFESGFNLTHPIQLASAAAVSLASGTATISGAISGTAAFRKVGAGTVILNTTNSSAGGTIVGSPSGAQNAGTLQIDNPAALGSGPITVTSNNTFNGTLALNLSGNNTFNNTLNGFNSQSYILGDSTPAHILNMAGTNTFTSGATVTGTGGNGLALKSDGGLLIMAGNITSAIASRNVQFNGSGDGRVDGSILDATAATATFGVQKDGTGAWTFTNTHGYTGSTNINNGILALSGSATLASNTIIIKPGAQMDVTATTSNNFNVVAGKTIQMGRSSSPSTDFVGGLTIDAGTLAVGATNTAVTATQQGDLTLNGGTIKLDLADVTTIGSGTNDLYIVNGNLIASGTNTLQINAYVGNALGSGDYTLINYTGSLTGGTSNFALAGLPTGTRQAFAIDTTSTPGSILLNVTGNSATLTWAGDGVANVWDVATTTNWLNGSPDVFYNNDKVQFTDSGSASPDVNLSTTLSPAGITVNSTQNYTFSGAGTLTGSGNLIKQGTGTLTLNTSNSYTGGTTLNQGTISFVAGGLSSGTVAVTGNAGILWQAGNTQDISSKLSIAAGQAATLDTDTNTITFASNLTGTGSMVKAGSGTLILAGTSNTISGGVTANAGMLQLGTLTQATVVNSAPITANAGGMVKFAMDNGTSGIAVPNVLSGAGTLVFAGNGTTGDGSYNLSSGNNSGFTGTIDVLAGARLNPQAASNLFGGGASVTVESGGGLYLPFAATLNNNITISGNGWAENAGTLGAIRLGGATLAGSITLAGDARIGAYSSSGTITGTMSGPAYNIEFGQGATSPTVGGTITLNPTSGTNTFATALISNLSTVALASATGALSVGTLTITAGTLTTPGTNLSAPLTVMNAGKIILTAGSTGYLTGTSSGNIQIGATGGTIDSGAFITTAGDLISDVPAQSGTFTKAGTGVLNLTGTNLYTGTTSITGGALQAVDGVSLPTSSNLYLNGGVFQSSGSFTRSLGTGASQVTWGSTVGGGFAAQGGNLTVTFSGAPDPLVWASTPNFVVAGGLIFGSINSDSEVNFTHNIDLNAGTRTVTVNQGTGTDFATLSGTISGAGATSGLSKAGLGKLVLTAPNTYGGTTTISAGTLAASGGDNRLPVTTATSMAANTTLDLTSTNQTLANMFFTSGTQTITGATASLVVSPATGLNMGHSSASGYINMAGLGSFTYNNAASNFIVGGTSTTTTIGSTWATAKNTTVTAATIGISTLSTASTGEDGVVILDGNTTFNSGSLLMNNNRGNGATIVYASGVTDPTFTLRGATGGTSRMSMTIANRSTSFATTQINLVDLVNGVSGTSTLDAMVGTLLLGAQNANTSTSATSTSAYFNMGAGTLDATTINMGILTADGASAVHAVNSSLALNGGTIKVSTMKMAENTVAASNDNVSAVFNFNSGTLALGTLTQGTNAGTGNTVAATLAWGTGTITNYNSSTDTTMSGVPVTLVAGNPHTFDALSGRSITVNSSVVESAGAGNLTKSGTGTLTMAGSSNYSGSTTVNDGVLNITGTYGPTVASTTNLTVASAGSAVVGGTADFFTVASPSSDLTVNGTLNIKSSAVTDVSTVQKLAGTGAVTVDKGTLNNAAGPRVGTLALTNGAVVAINTTDGDDAGPGVRGSIAGVSKVTSLAIDATSKLDLKNNGLIIPAAGSLNGSAITVDTLRAAIIAGRGGVGTGAATWSGAGGIGTSVFAFDETFDSIGYCWTGDPNLLVGPTDVNGESYDAGDYVVKYCAGADADLNGLVDDTDVAVIGLTYDGGASTGHHWYEGDFNYDGLINDDDVAIIGLAYNPSATPLSPSFYAALSAEYGASFASAFASGASTVVPEPTSLGLLAVGAMGLLRRRRK